MASPPELATTVPASREAWADALVPARRSWKTGVAYAFMVLVLAWAFAGCQFNLRELVTGVPQMGDLLQRSWPPAFSMLVDPQQYNVPPEVSVPELFAPKLAGDKATARDRWWSNNFPQTVLGATVQTIQMALVGTFLATLLAFPFGFLAARNTTPHPSVYYAVKTVTNFLRTVPDFAMGLVLVAAIGLGPFVGCLALAFSTTTVLIKLFAEAVENIDPGVVEAVRATGAGYLPVLSFSVIPQVIPDFISFVLYRFESNIRSAAVLGLIGAGGIGQIMTSYFRMFQYQEALMTIVVLMVLVMVVDFSSAQLRKLVL